MGTEKKAKNRESHPVEKISVESDKMENEENDKETNKEDSSKEEEPDLLTEIKNFIQEEPKSPSTPRASVRLKNRVKNDVLKQLTGEDDNKKKKKEVEEKKKPILLRPKKKMVKDASNEKPNDQVTKGDEDSPKLESQQNGEIKPKISLRCEDLLKKDVRISLPINNVKKKINLGPDISIKKIKKRSSDEEVVLDAKKTKVDESQVFRLLKKTLNRKEVKQVEFKNNFDRYFMTSERFCEHNDSISESSDDEIDGLLSHFVYLNKPKEDDEKTIYDLTKENPSWNVHMMPDGGFTLANLQSGPSDIPSIKKMVVFDSEFNIKVYVDNKLLENFKGVYDSYESMRDLLNELDEL